MSYINLKEKEKINQVLKDGFPSDHANLFLKVGQTFASSHPGTKTSIN